ncbi:MAG: hypothetical protein KF735_25915, partial [Chelatococcus sp.]|uniref:hypothetical protein n=1 Tax=Chelatococcus sp. TaxID=1953771 RepID=UPI001EB6BAE0
AAERPGPQAQSTSVMWTAWQARRPDVAGLFLCATQPPEPRSGSFLMIENTLIQNFFDYV